MAMALAAATLQLVPRRDGLSYAGLVVLTVTGSSPMRTIVARYISFNIVRGPKSRILRPRLHRLVNLTTLDCPVSWIIACRGKVPRVGLEYKKRKHGVFRNIACARAV